MPHANTGAPARSADVADDVPTCQHCAAAHANRSLVRPPPREIPRLKSRREVDTYPGLTAVTADTHAADVRDILARYEGMRSVACSFPGRHRHGEGLIVRTYCEIVLRMGLDCGDRWVANFRAIRRFVRESDQHLANRLRLNVEPEIHVKRAREMVARATALVAMRDRVERELIGLGITMSRRAAWHGGQRAMVVIPDPKHPKDSRLARIERLTGLELWESDFGTTGFGQAETRALLLREHVARDLKHEPDGGLSEETVRGHARELSLVAQMLNRLEQRLNAAAGFFGPMNLRVALHDAGLQRVLDTMRIEGGDLVWRTTSEAERRFRIAV